MTYHGGVRDNKYEILSTLEKHENTGDLNMAAAASGVRS
jgi:hypothetical protein